MNDDFDNKLRDKWEEKLFPVDDGHRQQMLALLDAQQRRKRGIIWWFGGAGLAVIGIGMVGLFYTNKSITTTTPILQVDSLSITTYIPEMTDNIVKENDLSSNTSEKSNLSEKGRSEMKNNVIKNDVQIKSSISSNVKSKPNTSTQNEISPVNNNVSALDKSDFKKEENSKKPLINNYTISETKEPIETKINPEVNNPVDVIESNVLRSSYITSPLESGYYSEIEYSGPVISGNIIPSFSNFHSLQLYADLGAGFIPSLNQVYSSGWNLMAGAGLKYKAGSKLNLLLSAGYLMQSDGFKFERTSVVQQPGFGSRSNFNTLVPDKLHFIYGKAGVQYELKRHVFSISGGGQWLYGAQGNIVITSVDELTGNTQTSLNDVWLKTDGMRHMLWNTEFLYGYRITPRICLQGGVKYYFSSIDIKDPALQQEGYYWKGHFSSWVPSFIINYHLYGKR